MINYDESYWNDVKKVVDCIPNLNRIGGKTIFITGVTGMICSSVVEVLFYLNNNCNAGIRLVLGGRSLDRVQKRFPVMKLNEDFNFINYDATKDFNLEIKPDYIIHGASNASPIAYASEPVETMLANIVGLNSLLNIAKKVKECRVLYVSSSEVYGNKNSNKPYIETDYGYLDILNQRASYPSSKRAAETLCVAYAEEYDVETVIVRPGHIYGPSITETDSRATAQFTRKAHDNEDIVMKSAGDQVRSYCYTLDCASAVLAVLINGNNGNAYNISNKESVVSIREIAETIANCAGRKIIFENPSDQEKKSYNLMKNSSLNSEKLESLGWKAVFSLEEGIEKTLCYYMGSKEKRTYKI